MLGLPVEIVPMARLYNNTWKSMNVHWESLRHPFVAPCRRFESQPSTSNRGMTLYCSYESVSIEIHDVSTKAKTFPNIWRMVHSLSRRHPSLNNQTSQLFYTPRRMSWKKRLVGVIDHYNQWATACCPYFSGYLKRNAEQVVCLAHPRVAEVG